MRLLRTTTSKMPPEILNEISLLLQEGTIEIDLQRCLQVALEFAAHGHVAVKCHPCLHPQVHFLER